MISEIFDLLDTVCKKIGKKGIMALMALFVFYIIFEYISGRLFNYWWHQSVGFGGLYLRNLSWEIGMFLIGAIITLGIFAINWASFSKSDKLSEEARTKVDGYKKYYIFSGMSMAFFVGLINYPGYFDVLQWIHLTPFKVLDPIWGNDISLYFVILPVIQEFLDIFILNFLAIFALDYILLAISEGLSVKDDVPMITRIWFSLLMTTLAGKFFLYSYDVLNNEGGLLAGGGLDDLFVEVTVCKLVALLFLLIGAAALSNFSTVPFVKKQYVGYRYMIGAAAAAAIIVVWIFATPFLTFAYAGIAGISSNEQVKHAPHMGYSINNTRAAYGLDEIEVRPYPNDVSLDASIKNSLSVRNLRVFDWRIVEQSLQQSQSLASCYQVGEPDVDRYYINGEEKQVIIATRNLNYDQIPVGWPNRHLVYTHDYGDLITSVNTRGADGNPLMYSGYIPNRANISEFKVNNPGIWYGEGQQDYIFTNTNTQELNHPPNNFIVYPGDGGIVVGNFFRKLIIADNLDLINILRSDAITYESRLHINRNVDERVQIIAPYLYLDKDNSLFIDNGENNKLMISGIVYGNKYPYSSHSNLGGMEVNYVKDSAKIVVDGVSGNMTFYVVSMDPLLETYMKIYPEVFKNISEMPESQKAHLKYSEDLFDVQSSKLCVFHMTNVSEYYMKDSRMEFSKEQSDDGGLEDSIAYSTVMEENGTTSFILMRTFTPASKTNLMAWMSVNQDWPGYGKMLLYQFDRSKFISGPNQIENAITMNEQMSSEIGDWIKGGATVIRGNTLIIPVDGGLISAEPIYASTSNNPMPQLRKVVVSYENPVTDEKKLEWAPTLDEALDLVFGEGSSPISGTSLGRINDGMSSDSSIAAEIFVLNSNGDIVETIPIQYNESFVVRPVKIFAAGNNSAATA